jgi:molybdate transport system substrate-binding protein
MRAWLLAMAISLVPSFASASEIRVVAAGSLKDAFTAISADFTQHYGSTFSSVWGPSGVLRDRLQAGEPFDLFASAALPHAQALTTAGVSGPSVLFARNTLCIVTDAGRQLDSENLIKTLLNPDIRIGTSTPVADPSGDYTWELFRKINAQRAGAFDILSAKAKQLIGGATTSSPVNGRNRLLAALDDHEIDLFIIYCSSARTMVDGSRAYKLIELPPELSVGPEYGLTVSRKAAPGAAEFAMYLLSPRGQSTLKSYGFIPVTLPTE